MAVLQPRGRRDSRASALSRRNWLDREDLESVEHALSTSPIEAGSYSGSLRVPGRSLYRRSVNTIQGTNRIPVTAMFVWRYIFKNDALSFPCP